MTLQYRRYLGSFLAITLLAGPVYAAAPMSLKWNELSGAIANERVIVDLKDGSRVKAAWISAQELAMVVSVTSNAHRTYKKGQVAIPREAIAGLRLIKMHKRGRIIGTSVGTVLGLAGAETIAIGTEGFLCGGIFESCPPNPNYDLERVGFAAMAALPVAGYFIVRWTDRQEIRITILPD